MMKSMLQVIVALAIVAGAIAAAAWIVDASNLSQTARTGTGKFIIFLIIATVITAPVMYRITKALVQNLKKRFAKPESKPVETKAAPLYHTPEGTPYDPYSVLRSSAKGDKGKNHD